MEEKGRPFSLGVYLPHNGIQADDNQLMQDLVTHFVRYSGNTVEVEIEASPPEEAEGIAVGVQGVPEEMPVEIPQEMQETVWEEAPEEDTIATAGGRVEEQEAGAGGPFLSVPCWQEDEETLPPGAGLEEIQFAEADFPAAVIASEVENAQESGELPEVRENVQEPGELPEVRENVQEPGELPVVRENAQKSEELTEIRENAAAEADSGQEETESKEPRQAEVRRRRESRRKELGRKETRQERKKRRRTEKEQKNATRMRWREGNRR